MDGQGWTTSAVLAHIFAYPRLFPAQPRISQALVSRPLPQGLIGRLGSKQSPISRKRF